LRRADHSSKGVLSSVLIRLRILRCEAAKVLVRSVQPAIMMMMMMIKIMIVMVLRDFGSHEIIFMIVCVVITIAIVKVLRNFEPSE
jgi:hypothetical protein